MVGCGYVSFFGSGEAISCSTIGSDAHDRAMLKSVFLSVNQGL